MNDRQQAYHDNTMAIVQDHRAKCSGGQCNVSLWLLLMMAREAGAKFTEDERKLFI